MPTETVRLCIANLGKAVPVGGQANLNLHLDAAIGERRRDLQLVEVAGVVVVDRRPEEVPQVADGAVALVDHKNDQSATGGRRGSQHPDPPTASNT